MLWILLISLFQATINTNTLLGVIDFFRHGPRSPINIDKQGKDILNVFWDVDKGELTNRGIRELYLSGVYIRNRYIDEKNLLNKEINAEEYSIYSTDTNRTIMSAYSKIEGLFRNRNEFKQSFFPVKVLTEPSILFQNHFDSICPKIDKLDINSENYSEYYETILTMANEFNSTLWPQLKPKLNTKINVLNLKTMNHIAEALNAAKYENKDISHLKLSKKDLITIEKFKFLYVVNGKRPDKAIKFMSIPLFYKIFQLIDVIMNRSSTIKYYGFSVHDTNQATLLRVLNKIYPQIFDLNDIKLLFSSNLLFEIYSDNTIKILFNNEPLTEFDLSSFKRDVIKYIGKEDDYYIFCGLNKQSYYVQFFLWMLVCTMVLVIILILILIFYRNKNRSSTATELSKQFLNL